MGHAAGEPAHRVHLLRLEKLGLKALLIGHVVGDDETPRTAAEIQLMGEDLHGDEAPVLQSMPPGAVHGRPSRLGLVGKERGLESRHVLVRLDVGDPHAQELLPAVAVVGHGDLVDLQEAQVLAVEDPHRVGIAGEEETEALLALAQGPLGPQPRHPSLGFPQRPLDGRDEPSPSVLEHQVRRSGFQRLHRPVLADGPGKEDERRLRLARGRLPQGGQSVETGQRVVGKDEVEPLRLEGLHEGFARAHAAHRDREAFPLQQRADERSVVVAVLEVKDTELRHRARPGPIGLP